MPTKIKRITEKYPFFVYICTNSYKEESLRLMENYIVSARKYRPASFESVVGQHALTTTLKNAIASGKLAHAYLFCGPRGVGKTTCARIFAKTINCMSPTPEGEACDQCESCTAFNEQRSYNIHELDAASNNSVDDIRQLVEQVRIPPQIGKYKVYIIDEVHMLSTSAFNAFLKTLEEPPRHAIFILATTEKHKIIPTILSRCQIYDFSRISVEDTVKHLSYVATKEGISAEAEALNVIALKSDGGMRDALSIFDQVVSFTGGNITYNSVIENLNVLDYEYYFRLTDYFLNRKVSEPLLLLNDILNKGFDGGPFITGLSSHFRDLLVSKDSSTLSLLEVGASIRERYKEQAGKCPTNFLYRAIKLCNDCELNYRISKNKRLLVELTLIQLAQLTDDEDSEGSGRSPKQRIKPITTQAAENNQNQVAYTASPITQPAAASLPKEEKAKGQTPHTRTVVQPESDVASPANERNITNALHTQQEEKKIPVIKKLGVSIKHTKIEKEEVVAKAISTAEAVEDSIFNEKDVNHYWLTYAQELPQEQIALARRMKIIRPKLIDTTTIEIVVDNEVSAKDFIESLPQLQRYLRQRLKNRKATLTVRVSATEETSRPVNRAEKFQMMAEKNNALLLLKDEFGLEFY